MPALSHVKSNTIADFTGTVTVMNSSGGTQTAAATDLVRPVDWNSAHNVYQSISGNTAGSSTMSGTNIVFGGSGGIQLSASSAAGAATMWMQDIPCSYYANLPVIVGTTTLQPRQSTSAVIPFHLYERGVFDFVRVLQSGATSVAPTSAGTTANTTWSAGASFSHNFVVYSRGIGGNSTVMQYVTSTQVPESYSYGGSAAGTGSRYSVSVRYSLPGSAGVIGFTKDYSSSLSNITLHSSQLTDLTGLKQIDYYFPMSLSAGQYWLVYGASSSTNSGVISLGIRDLITYNFYGVSQINNNWGTLGGATASSVNHQPGLGSFSTGGAAGTTATIPLSAPSSSASQNILYFQLMRIA